MTEFTDLGARCAFEGCGQADFLPFNCPACARVYCLEHRSYAAHGCIDPNTTASTGTSKASRREADLATKTACSLCGTLHDVVVTCEDCNLIFCLPHRSPLDHACKPVISSGGSAAGGRGASASSSSSSSSAAAAKTAASPAPRRNKKAKRPLTGKALARAQKVKLMKIKGKAKGRKGVPDAHRFYVELGFCRSAGTKLSVARQPAFVDGREIIGRSLDELAAACGVANRNSTTATAESGDRLGLYCCPPPSLPPGGQEEQTGAAAAGAGAAGAGAAPADGADDLRPRLLATSDTLAGLAKAGVLVGGGLVLLLRADQTELPAVLDAVEEG